jgi:hypothetical protein
VSRIASEELEAGVKGGMGGGLGGADGVWWDCSTA